jgi:hypothetical protein
MTRKPIINMIAENCAEGFSQCNKDLAGGMAQVEECLPNQCKTLSSNANTAKKKKKE